MPLLPWSHGAASCRKEIDIFIYSSIYIILYIYIFNISYESYVLCEDWQWKNVLFSHVHLVAGVALGAVSSGLLVAFHECSCELPTLAANMERTRKKAF